MANSTLAARQERAVSHLESLLGRLEKVCGTLEAWKPLGLGNGDQPPQTSIEEQEKELDKYLERRKEELDPRGEA
jgi:hypothetical protein